MTDIYKAAQQALDALEDHAKQYPHMQKGYTVDAITALRAALMSGTDGAQQQPVAWLPSAEWTACVKLPVTVHVRQQRPGETHVSTREGITPVKPDDLIMRGVSGEEYPIGREIFERTYRLGEAPQPKPAEQPAEQAPVRGEWQGYTWNPYAVPQPKAEPQELEQERNTLLAALKDMADLYDTDEGCRSLPQYKAARAAIAKVEGGAA